MKNIKLLIPLFAVIAIGILWNSALPAQTNLPAALTNAPVVPGSITVSSEPIQTNLQRHWPAITVALMWLVREAHIWWPFLTDNGGIEGIFILLWRGKQTTQPTPLTPKPPTP